MTHFCLSGCTCRSGDAAESFAGRSRSAALFDARQRGPAEASANYRPAERPDGPTDYDGLRLSLGQPRHRVSMYRRRFLEHRERLIVIQIRVPLEPAVVRGHRSRSPGSCPPPRSRASTGLGHRNRTIIALFTRGSGHDLIGDIKRSYFTPLSDARNGSNARRRGQSASAVIYGGARDGKRARGNARREIIDAGDE